MSEWHNSKDWKDARANAKRILEPRCVVCHKELEDNDWTIDHITPPSMTGGIPDNSLENLQSMCRSCNSKKQDKTLVRTDWRNPKWFT
jgi:5-methylcytosine-specific restriction endonuclease McrA